VARQAEACLAAGLLWHDEGLVFTTSVGTSPYRTTFGPCDRALTGHVWITISSPVQTQSFRIV